MCLAITALVFLGGLFYLLFGLAFLFQPESAASALGIAPLNAQGMSTLRGDFTGFFGIVGISMLWGAWQRKGDLLLVPAIIMLIIIAGRLVSLAIDGDFDGYLIPLAAEVGTAVILLWARNMLPHHTLEEVGD